MMVDLFFFPQVSCLCAVFYAVTWGTKMDFFAYQNGTRKKIHEKSYRLLQKKLFCPLKKTMQRNLVKYFTIKKETQFCQCVVTLLRLRMKYCCFIFTVYYILCLFCKNCSTCGTETSKTPLFCLYPFIISRGAFVFGFLVALPFVLTFSCVCDVFYQIYTFSE